ncbi:MAG: hypothetical protein B7Z10_09760 [Rhodobacterales bacterium 32-66-7]|nr:MAG: hypothetical protein B7Z10_09760 [Rhodobacterales bacterium 32-66-7]
MREGKPRLAIFGDSHYACLKQADVQGLVDLSALEVEYWGHVGGRFRNLEFRGGAIHPTDDFTAQRFAKFNEKGRLFLPASDFDVILLAGARTYLARSFLALLRLRAQGPLGALAATSAVRVLLAPIAFYTEYPADLAQMTPEMPALAPDIVPFLWEEVARITTEAGMTLIPQPAGTITNWLWTRAEYAVAGYLAKQDHEHHNAAYGALVLTAMLDHLRRVVLPDAAPAGMLPPG